MVVDLLLVAAGVALLYLGGELLVNGAIDLASGFGVSPLVIGLTVVAFATSAPELAASITAALRGATDLALGNVIGSNIANLGLILGISAMIGPLAAGRRFIRREVAFMMLVTVLLYPLLASDTVGRWHGLVLLALLAFFLLTLLRDPEAAESHAVEVRGGVNRLSATLRVLLGIALLVVGAQALVNGAADLARLVGIGERVIGLTLVALGTSLPELATCLIAARKGQTDIVLGNLIGSNVFNLLCILGFTALIRPIPVAPEVLQLDFWMMLATSALVMIVLGLRQRIVRLEGALLVAGYLLYSAYLFV